jgi:hypothetical protein
MMGSSVSEQVLREFRTRKVLYPFSDKHALIDAWSLDAKPFPNQRYVIGQDFGLLSPIKSPADALFSRAFIKLGSKVMPEMLSGKSWTAASYGVIHNTFAAKFAPDDEMLSLGDDMNLMTSQTDSSVFAPYEKVKSTDPVKNHKKILGLFTAFSDRPDPEGAATAIIGVVPRIIKTISSASKRGTYWGESISNLPLTGKKELTLSEETEVTVSEDLEAIKPYMQWIGPRRELKQMLMSLWGRIPAPIWRKLIGQNEELVHRLSPDTDEADLDDE